MRRPLRLFPRAVFVTALLIVTGSWAARPGMEGMPRGVIFSPADDANLSFKGKLGERCSRSYTIRNETAGTIRVYNFRLNDTDFEPLHDKKGAEIPPNGAHIVTVVYKPTRAGATSEARLTFNVRLRPNEIRNPAVRFSGTEGDSCAPPGDGQGGAEPPAGDPVPPAANETDPGTGFEDFGPVAQDERQTSICVRFHYVTEGSTDASQRPTQERLTRCLKVASGWFSGVDFVMQPAEGAPHEVAKLDDGYDPHCINIYLVHDHWFEDHRPSAETAEDAGRTVGDTDMHSKPFSEAWRGGDGEPGVVGDLSAAGVNQMYLDSLTPGTTITAEAGPVLCSTIGHELGHALGLGVVANKKHLQPEDGQEIGDESHLMHKAGRGSKLTDKEQAVATRVAHYLDENLLTRCSGSSHIAEPPRTESPTAPSVLRSVSIYNEGASLRFVARPSVTFDSREFTGALTLELDADLDQAPDLSVSYTFVGGEWKVQGKPALPDSIPLALPGFMLPTDVSARAFARGIELEFPRDAVPGEGSTFGWRLILDAPGLGAREILPTSGFDEFDLTVPAVAIDLRGAGEGLHVAAGDEVPLSGSLVASSTFTGTVKLFAVLTSGATAHRIPLATHASPIPSTWSGAVKVPESLANRTSDLAVHAVCEECRLATSVLTTVTDDRGSANKLPLVMLVLLVAGVAIVLFARWRSREQGS